VEAGWHELRDTARDLGIEWDDGLTVRSTGAALARCFGRTGEPEDALGRPARRGPQADPEAAQALQRLVGLLERARYSRALPADATTEQQVRADVDTCVRAMRAGAGPRRRASAAWLPRSVLRWGAGRGAGQAARRRRRAAVLGGPGVDRAV
jgi:hypothetical protein